MIEVVKETVVRSLQAIELLAREARWTRMSDIATQLELEKGPGHRVLAQLCEQGWEPERYDAFYALLQEASAKLCAVWPRQSVGAHASEAA